MTVSLFLEKMSFVRVSPVMVFTENSGAYISMPSSEIP